MYYLFSIKIIEILSGVLINNVNPDLAILIYHK